MILKVLYVGQIGINYIDHAYSSYFVPAAVLRQHQSKEIKKKTELMTDP